jgi:4-hydroxymandelate oxidase
MEQLINLRDYEAAARDRLRKELYDWYAGGAADEITLRENEEAWSRLRLRPRVLRDVSACDLATTVLGRPVTMPVLTGPCSLNGLVHPDGELAVARAASSAGIIQIISTGASYTLEEIATASTGTRWFQIYCLSDRSVSRALAERAASAGYAALCLTVDAPVEGLRERHLRNGFPIPPEGTRVGNLEAFVGDGSYHTARHKFLHDATITWSVVEWFRGITRLPVVLKGIVSPEDARLAVEHGADGIVVSNHGGRLLDTVVTTAAALGGVVEAVDGRVEVFVDGGIRRGTDVLKALALGARAVLVGRPYLWGLAVDGEAGARRVLEIQREELRITMALTGCAHLSDVARALIQPRTGS